MIASKQLPKNHTDKLASLINSLQVYQSMMNDESKDSDYRDRYTGKYYGVLIALKYAYGIELPNLNNALVCANTVSAAFEKERDSIKFELSIDLDATWAEVDELIADLTEEQELAA